jgi:hypothetical protein
MSQSRKSTNSRKRASKFTGKGDATNTRRKTWSPYKNLEITVIDEHNDALFPIWRAQRKGKMPAKGVKLMHFDSHPDMGCLDEDDKDMKRSEVVPKIFSGKFNVDEVHKATCIGTYIPVLVLQGLVSEVTWVCGNWCHQMTPGTYHLVVGRCKKTGRMKMATQGDKRSAILDYWMSDGTAAKLDELECQRPWTLNVVRFNKGGKMSEKNKQRLVDLFRTGEWVLDIDEDYLSCNNPHGIEFRANFGDETYNDLAKIFDVEVKDYYGYWQNLEKLTTDNVYKLPKGQFLKHDLTQKLMKTLETQNIDEPMDPEEAMLMYQQICLKVFPRKVDTNKWNCEDIYGNKDITETGEMTCVPHHISQIPEILNMVNDTVDLFCRLGKRPLLTTVATSRADRYLPDPQAALINTLVLGMLRRQWPGARTKRTDIPDNTAEEMELTNPKPALLFRGKTPDGKRIPVSR